jgi:hypothetical protein
MIPWRMMITSCLSPARGATVAAGTCSAPARPAVRFPRNHRYSRKVMLLMLIAYHERNSGGRAGAGKPAQLRGSENGRAA